MRERQTSTRSLEIRMTITRVGVVGRCPLAEAFACALERAGIVAVVGDIGSGNAVPAAGAVRGETANGSATLQQAAEEDTVLLAVLWTELGETLSGIADWEGRILIDATNPVLPGSRIADLGGKTSSEIVRELSPGAQLVKAFNTLSPAALTVQREPGAGRRVVFLSGDHARAKVEVGRLIVRLGFAAIDLGGLSSGGRLQQCPDGPLCDPNLVRIEE